MQFALEHKTIEKPGNNPAFFMSLLFSGLFAQSLRYTQKIILGISNRCLWLFFFACPSGA